MKELSILLLWVATAINLASAVMNFYCGYQRTRLKKLYEKGIEAQQQSMFIRQFTDGLSSHLFKQPPMH
jgi:hypothetical protein